MPLVKFSDKVKSKEGRKHIMAADLDRNFQQLQLQNPPEAKVFKTT